MASFSRVENLCQLFQNGMKRGVQIDWPEPASGKILNLGSGNYPIPGADNLDQPHWDAPFLLDYSDGSCGAVHAYHFLEHLDPDELKRMIQEIDRVLKPEGKFYYCVPYAMAPIAFMDATHRTFWTEETMRTLLQSRGYQSAVVEDTLKMIFQVIMGLNSQNLAVLGVLEKVK